MVPETLKLLVGSVVRWLLNSIFVWLIARGLLTNDESYAFYLWVVGAISTLVWSQIQKLRTVFKIDEALRLPARSSFEDLDKAIG